MATDRVVSLPDLAMSSANDDSSDSPYTAKLQTALRTANPGFADILFQDTARKRSHTPDQGGGLGSAGASVHASALPSSSTIDVSPSAGAVLPQLPHIPPPTPDMAAAQQKQETNI